MKRGKGDSDSRLGLIFPLQSGQWRRRRTRTRTRSLFDWEEKRV